MLVQLSGYAELELFLMLFGAIAITVMLISQRCPTLGVQRYNGGAFRCLLAVSRG